MNRHVIDVGMRKLFLLDDFLPDSIQDAFLSHVIDQKVRFAPSSRTLNDPEYQRASTLSDASPFAAIFEKAVIAAWREILLSLAVEAFEPKRFDLHITLLKPGAYRKPRSDALHSDAASILSLLYVVGRQPKPYEGGDLRFFEYNPYEQRNARFKRTLEFAGIPNNLVIFPSTLFYAMNEIMEAAPGFSNECFLLDGTIA